MFAKKSEKWKLFLIAIKLSLCLVLLVSSTYALFTHESRISVGATAAKMDMELLVYIDGEYKNVEDISTNIFGDGYWEAGQTRLVHFKVVNNSNINVKYSLQLLSVIDSLEGALEYCAFESAEIAVAAESWASLCEGKTVKQMSSGLNLLSGDAYIPMVPGDEASWTVAVHLKEASGNEYAAQSGEIFARIHAVQGNADLMPQ